MYVLPNKDAISYVPKASSPKPTFTDSFNNDGAITDEPTKAVFFISYNEKAFSINCQQEEEFYKNLGISSKSLSKILLPEDKSIVISGFRWYFFDINEPELSFKRTNTGICDQLYQNYVMLAGPKDSRRATDLLSFIKSICIKESNAKLEVLVDENITMDRLQRIFDDGLVNSQDDVVRNALEILIIARGKSNTYRYYIQAIKCLLNQTPFDYAQLNRIPSFASNHFSIYGITADSCLCSLAPNEMAWACFGSCCG